MYRLHNNDYNQPLRRKHINSARNTTGGPSWTTDDKGEDLEARKLDMEE